MTETGDSAKEPGTGTAEQSPARTPHETGDAPLTGGDGSGSVGEARASADDASGAALARADNSGPVGEADPSGTPVTGGDGSGAEDIRVLSPDTGGAPPSGGDGSGPAEEPALGTWRAGWSAGERRSRRAAAVAAVVLGALLAVVIAVTTPWHPVPGARPAAADPARDFTPGQIVRGHAFNSALNPPAYAGLVVGLVVALLLGLTPLGARLLGAVGRPLRWWPVRLAGAAVVLCVATRLVTVPFDIWSERILHRYRLSTQTWGAWATDQLTSLGVTLVIWLLVLFGLHLLIRRFPRGWWAGAAAGGFVLVTVVSFGYPVVVEPLFDSFTPMRAGPQRDGLLAMARADGVPARQVLVADESRRTTTLNAYVSGFGSTRRIVVYDTLLQSASPREVRLIVAHELGHAKRDDVLTGTLVGALGVSAGACLLYLVMTSPALLRRAGVRSAADPRSVALLLAGVTVLSQLALPVQNMVSRHIEARADVHALGLTRDPATFVAMQRELAVRNIDDLSPDLADYLLWSTHPTGPQRIELGRAWARAHGAPVPAPRGGR